jgi:hypothetical protein
MGCDHDWKTETRKGRTTHTCRKCGFRVTSSAVAIPTHAAKDCAHQWIVELATLPSGHTFHSAYCCGVCGAVAGICPMGDHPFGHPDFRSPGRSCSWCQSANPFAHN